MLSLILLSPLLNLRAFLLNEVRKLGIKKAEILGTEMIKGVTLDLNQLEHFEVEWGKLNQKLDKSISKPWFRRLEQGAQKAVIEQRLLQNKAIARRMTLGKFPEILQAADGLRQDKVNALQQPVGGVPPLLRR